MSTNGDNGDINFINKNQENNMNNVNSEEKNEIILTSEEEKRYQDIFDKLACVNAGIAKKFLESYSNLDRLELKEIWNIASQGKNSYLKRKNFFKAMKLIELAEKKKGVRKPILVFVILEIVEIILKELILKQKARKKKL